jgi:peroxiredoxin
MGGLKAEIAQMRADLEGSQSDEVRKILQRSIQRLAESGAVDAAIGVGEMFPHFSLPNAGGDAVSSEDFLARGPLVVCFYRGGWDPYCNLELRAYQAILGDLRALGADFIAISPQLPEESLNMAAKANLSFEVLTDMGNSLAEHLGLAHELVPAVVDIYRSMGYDLERINGITRWTLPIPATYVVDTSGKIAEAFIQPDYTVRMEPERVLEVIKGL